MILDVSSRTDIPSFYSKWLLKRFKEGYVYVKHPMYPNKISKLELDNKLIDCVVFCSKNYKPLLKDIDKIKDQCCDVGVIQLLNAHAIGGRRHVLQGTIEAIKAFQRDENLANDLGIELCLRTSAQRQISKALDLLNNHWVAV